MKSLKKYIPKTLKQIIVKLYKSQMLRIKLNTFIKKSRENKIFLIGTPKHGNLGDQAIAYAEIKFLEENCKNFDVFEIQFDDFNYYFNQLKRVVKPGNILMLHGGGNMGVEYLREEELRRKVIANFKNQKIISFPQTIYFGDSDFGVKELEKTKEIYSSHPNLTIIAREEISFNLMRQIFVNNNVILTPDIVMYLNIDKLVNGRKNILFCFRDDTEKVVSSSLKQRLYDQLSVSNNVIITDTVINHIIRKHRREDELNKIWSSFQESKLVITDRLHGMVFAAITCTPCIAFSNYNHKVVGTYEWIKHLPYIRFIDDNDDINVHFNDLLKLERNKYENNFAMRHFDEIVKCINTTN